MKYLSSCLVAFACAWSVPAAAANESLARFRPSCPAAAPAVQVDPVRLDCEQEWRNKSLTPFLYQACVGNLQDSIKALSTNMRDLRIQLVGPVAAEKKVLSKEEIAALRLDRTLISGASSSVGVWGKLEGAMTGLGGYIAACTQEGFTSALKAQFPVMDQSLLGVRDQAKGLSEVVKSRSDADIIRYLLDLQGTADALDQGWGTVKAFYEQQAYLSNDQRAREAMARSRTLVGTPGCSVMEADKEAITASEQATEHVRALKRMLGEDRERQRCAREFLRTHRLDAYAASNQNFAIRRYDSLIAQAPARIQQAEALLAETAQLCAQVRQRAAQCEQRDNSPPPPPTMGPAASRGACAGSLAGTWRATQRIAGGAHVQEWAVAPDGRAVLMEAGKPSRIGGMAQITGNTFSLSRNIDPVAPRNTLLYTAELDASCTRGPGTVREAYQLRPPSQQAIEMRRVGDAAAPARPPAAPPGAPPVVAGASQVAPPLGDTRPPGPGTQAAVGGVTPYAPPVAPMQAPAPQARQGNACGHTLGGGIHGKWQQLGGERGMLGCATMSEQDALRSPQGSTGKWANFRHGLITWMFTGPKVNQGFEVHGVIKNLYMQMGGSGSWLGFPLSDEYDVPGGRRSDFEGGHIVWSRATNQARAERAGVAAAGTATGCDASGVWQAATDGIGAARWTLQGAGGRYAAREQGLGNATGTATLAGSRLRVDWVTGGLRGYYEWDLGAGCAGGGGRLVFTHGRAGMHNSRITR